MAPFFSLLLQRQHAIFVIMAEEKEVGSKLPFANWLKKKKKKTKENEKIISVETAQTNILYFSDDLRALRPSQRLLSNRHFYLRPVAAGAGACPNGTRLLLIMFSVDPAPREKKRIKKWPLGWHNKSAKAATAR